MNAPIPTAMDTRLFMGLSVLAESNMNSRMKRMYKIIALMGEAGSGKDRMM
jgi:hypothetical protein